MSFGLATTGRLDSIVVLCALVALACCLCSAAVWRLELSKKNTIKGPGKAAAYAAVSCAACCLVACGLMYVHSVATSTGAAAESGAWSIGLSAV